jgi:hypothetical protein
MYDFGNTSSHSNYVHYGDVAGSEGGPTMSAAWWYECNLLTASDNLRVYGKHNATTGWEVLLDATESFRIFDDTVERGVSTTTFTVDSTPHSGMFRMGGGTGKVYTDAGDAQTISSWAPTDTSHDIVVGEVNKGSNGAACKLGQVMVWGSTDIGTLAPAQYHNNSPQEPPSLSNLTFWARLVGTPPSDAEVPFGTSGTKSGTVTEHVDPIDDYYAGGALSFNWLIGLHWATLIGASSLFGSALRMENPAKLLRAIRQEMGCAFYGTKENHDMLINAAEFPKRPVFV